jgi:hypothetical protein
VIADTFMVALLVRVEVPAIFRSCVRSCFCCDQMHRAGYRRYRNYPSRGG